MSVAEVKIYRCNLCMCTAQRAKTVKPYGWISLVKVDDINLDVVIEGEDGPIHICNHCQDVLKKYFNAFRA